MDMEVHAWTWRYVHGHGGSHVEAKLNSPQHRHDIILTSNEGKKLDIPPSFILIGKVALPVHLSLIGEVEIPPSLRLIGKVELPLLGPQRVLWGRWRS